MTPLAPRWAHAEEQARLRSDWERDGRVRVEPIFAETRAAAYLLALRARDYVGIQHVDPSGATPSYQLWRSSFEPGEGCDHALCELGRWLLDAGRAWMSELTGVALAPAAERRLSVDCAAKASFFDAYDDAAPGRALAFQLHLTPASWPPAWGGHLEIVAPPGDPDASGVARAPVATLAPAWNALDLFDLRPERAHPTWRRMPMILHHLDGFVVSGWFASP